MEPVSDTDLAQQFQSSQLLDDELSVDDPRMVELLNFVTTLGSEEASDPYLIPESACASPPPRGTCASPLGNAGVTNPVFCWRL